jgi:hypothetical protein
VLSDDNVKALIVSHVPPGFFERNASVPAYMTNLDGDGHYNEAIADVLDRYGDAIVAHVYGHTHTDTFRMIRVG